MISTNISSTNSPCDVLRVHQFLPRSQANGPGARAVIWVQGCTLGCPGCFNGPTHPAVGQLRPVGELFEEIVALSANADIEGITISGGEPLQQLPAVTQLLRRIKSETTLSVVLFTGFSWPELERMGQAQAHKQPSSNQDAGRYPLPVLEYVDVLIAGRYNQELHLAQDLRGSSNKLLYFLTARYTQADFHAVPRTEVVISPQGEIILSGINPLKLTN